MQKLHATVAEISHQCKKNPARHVSTMAGFYVLKSL